jgi:hypothetical protein
MAEPVEGHDNEGRWRPDINAWGAQVPASTEPKDDPIVERQLSSNRSSKKGS